MLSESLGSWARRAAQALTDDQILAGCSSEASTGVAALLASRLAAGTALVVVTDREENARDVANDLTAWGVGPRVMVFPAWETLPFERVAPSVATVGERLRAVVSLTHRSSEPIVIVASIRAALQRLSPDVCELNSFSLCQGQEKNREELIDWLACHGYHREPRVLVPGEFAVRGSLVDVFASNGSSPVRIDFFGNEIESLHPFDAGTQRSERDPVARLDLLPAREAWDSEWLRDRVARVSRSVPEIADRLTLESADPLEGLMAFLLGSSAPTMFDLLGPDDRVIVTSPGVVQARAVQILADEEAIRTALLPTWNLDEAPGHLVGVHANYEALFSGRARVDEVRGDGSVGDAFSLSFRDVEGAVSRLGAFVRDGFRVVVAGATPERARALSQGFARLDRYAPVVEAGSRLSTTPGMTIVAGVPLSTSMVMGSGKFVVVADAGIVRPTTPTRVPTKASAALVGVAPGTLVVHDSHGIARYQGLVSREMGGVARDYLLLEFAGSDRVYLPSEQIGKVRPYVGGENPALSRLSGGEWQRTVARARREANEVAQELVVLYQKRLVAKGHAVGDDTPWQQELEDMFPYELTPDQSAALVDVKSDLERATPMDRILCGDVGFGKTEVALRAAFKVIQDGGQVAVLAPTTLLASQHYDLFRERFEPFSVNVALLSRFVTPAQARATRLGAQKGSIDCVVATHSLVARETAFRRLGLLIVDEEQQFGVTHKELIKQKFPDVDVLTMSATPIPRTLELSLVGIRDVSLLRTPPRNRLPILTHVGPEDPAAISEAIRREMLRGGQVFYVHNRVQDIETVAARVQALVPSARVLVAHGQMKEHQLESVVNDFWHQKADVLVCTTIIENGIDLPTVNTLIVDSAHSLGLSQLHQLRGRVGRSGERAYAYLFYPATVAMSETALERLRTIAENTDLGAGYRIALRDLELRGAGTILGERQSGHMATVGYDLYVRLVSGAVAAMKGEEEQAEDVVKIDLPLSYAIPESYVEEEDERLDLYQRLLRVHADQDITEIADELKDRFGSLPSPVQSLLEVSRLRLRLARWGIGELRTGRSPRSGRQEVIFSPVTLAASKEVRLARVHGGARYRKEEAELALEIRSNRDLVHEISRFLGDLLDS